MFGSILLSEVPFGDRGIVEGMVTVVIQIALTQVSEYNIALTQALEYNIALAQVGGDVGQ